MLDTLRIIGALLLLFFIPGFLMVQAMFPRKGELDVDFDWLYRFTLGIGLSIVLTILVCFGLNALGVNPETGMGYVTTVPITLALVVISLAFFGVGWFRGAFPIMGRLHPSLIRFPPRDPKLEDIPYLADKEKRYKHQWLEERRFSLIREIDNAERLIEVHANRQRDYYIKRKEERLAELREVEDQIKEIETEMEILPVVDEGPEDEEVEASEE
jgi:hypothetical protein